MFRQALLAREGHSPRGLNGRVMRRGAADEVGNVRPVAEADEAGLEASVQLCMARGKRAAAQLQLRPAREQDRPEELLQVEALRMARGKRRLKRVGERVVHLHGP